MVMPKISPAAEMEIERSIDSSLYRYVIGIDEVGRGSWAGPLCVGAVVYDLSTLVKIATHVREGFKEPYDNVSFWETSLLKVNDSKLLSPILRKSLVSPIQKLSAATTFGYVQPFEIDRFGMSKSLEMAAGRALSNLGDFVVDSIVLIDGPIDFSHASTVMTVVKGDRRSFAIASASIIAKVNRDDFMIEEAENFPWYQFEANKGYPSPAHVSALHAVGLSAIHRKSWSYVEKLPWANSLVGSETVATTSLDN